MNRIILDPNLPCTLPTQEIMDLLTERITLQQEISQLQRTVMGLEAELATAEQSAEFFIRQSDQLQDVVNRAHEQVLTAKDVAKSPESSDLLKYYEVHKTEKILREGVNK